MSRMLCLFVIFLNFPKKLFSGGRILCNGSIIIAASSSLYLVIILSVISILLNGAINIVSFIDVGIPGTVGVDIGKFFNAFLFGAMLIIA